MFDTDVFEYTTLEYFLTHPCYPGQEFSTGELGD